MDNQPLMAQPFIKIKQIIITSLETKLQNT